jgi:hypothetical protein
LSEEEEMGEKWKQEGEAVLKKAMEVKGAPGALALLLCRFFILASHFSLHLHFWSKF